MASREGRRRHHHHHNLVPLAALISKEVRNERLEKPTVRYGNAAQSKKGEDYFLMKTDCQRVPGNPSSTFSVFAVSFLALFFCFFYEFDFMKVSESVVLNPLSINWFICS